MSEEGHSRQLQAAQMVSLYMSPVASPVHGAGPLQLGYCTILSWLGLGAGQGGAQREFQPQGHQASCLAMCMPARLAAIPCGQPTIHSFMFIHAQSQGRVYWLYPVRFAPFAPQQHTMCLPPLHSSTEESLVQMLLCPVLSWLLIESANDSRALAERPPILLQSLHNPAPLC